MIEWTNEFAEKNLISQLVMAVLTNEQKMNEWMNEWINEWMNE